VYLKVLNINNNTNKVSIITGSSRGYWKGKAMQCKAMQWNLQRPAIKLSFNARDNDELNKDRNDIVSAKENSRFNISS